MLANLVSRVDDRFEIARLKRERLLAEDVEVGGKRVEQLWHMKAVRRRDADGFEPGIQDLAIIRVYGRGRLGQGCLDALYGIGIGIGKSRHTHARHRCESLGVNQPQRPAPDDSYAKLRVHARFFVRTASIPCLLSRGRMGYASSNLHRDSSF